MKKIYKVETETEIEKHFHTPLKDETGATYELNPILTCRTGRDVHSQRFPARICAECRSVYMERSLFASLDEKKADKRRVALQAVETAKELLRKAEAIASEHRDRLLAIQAEAEKFTQ